MENLILKCGDEELIFELRKENNVLYGELSTKKIAAWCREKKVCTIRFRDFEADLQLSRYGFNWTFEIGEYHIVISTGLHGKTSVNVTGGDISAE